MRSHAALILPLLVGMAPSVVAKGAKKRISVVNDSSKFNVDRFYDGRGKPYRIVFWENGRNIFYFNESGQLKTVKKREEIYSVFHKTNGDLKRVETKTLGDPPLPDNSVWDTDMDTYPCDDCVETLELMCGEGVASVCELVDYGSPLSDDALASIKIMCETFADACSASEAEETCEGQCDDVEEPEEGGLNACLDPASDDYKCTYTDKNNLRLEDCGFVEEDFADISTCFEDFGKTNIERLFFAYNVEPTNNKFTTFPEEMFSGLTELKELAMDYVGLTSLPQGIFSDLISLDLLSLSNNELETLPAGIFSGLDKVEYMYLYNNNLVTLPSGIFSDMSKIDILNLDGNNFVGFPPGVFSGMTNLGSLVIADSNLTTLPEGLFSGFPELYALRLVGNDDLQCVPFNEEDSFALVFLNDEAEDLVGNGFCECTPVEAIMCPTGTSCAPGKTGYTCES